MKKISLFVISSAVLLIAGCSGSPQEPQETAQSEMAATGKAAKKTVTVTPIADADTIDAGLVAGEKVPSTTFKSGTDETGMDSILAQGPAVFVFTRSVAWCPYCQTQLKSINAIVDDLGERGYKLYGISYDKPGEQDRFSKNQMLDYQMLSDEGSKAIDAFGLRDPQYTEGRAVGVPYASVYIVGKDGTILAKSVSNDYKKRPTNEQILALVDAI